MSEQREGAQRHNRPGGKLYRQQQATTTLYANRQIIRVTATRGGGGNVVVFDALTHAVLHRWAWPASEEPTT